MPTNHAGRLMIIQRTDTPGDWASPINLCGINNTTFTITNAVNSEERVNCADRSQVVETLKEYGAQDLKFDASGLFESDAEGQFAVDQGFSQARPELRVFVPGHGFYECADWLISSVVFTGAPTGSLQFSASFEASGTVTFTAIP